MKLSLYNCCAQVRIIILRLIFVIILLLSYFDTVIAQNFKLIESKHISDNSKDCRKIGNCVSDKYIKRDTLHLIIYFDNNCRDLSFFQDSFSFYNDTLSVNLIDTTKIKNPTICDSGNNKIGKVIANGKARFYRPCFGDYDTQKFQYLLSGFNNLPKVFQFNHQTLYDCPTHSIQYEIFKSDTVNVINFNGKKEGLWIQYYDTGELKEKDWYKDAVFDHAITYDKNGNILQEYNNWMRYPVELKK